MFSISERISQDMKLALAHPERFKEHFVIRKWVDLDPSLEFRGFVKNNKLNALSQVLFPSFTLLTTNFE